MINWIETIKQNPPCNTRILVKTTSSRPYNAQIYTARFECGKHTNVWHIDLPGKVLDSDRDDEFTHWALPY